MKIRKISLDTTTKNLNKHKDFNFFMDASNKRDDILAWFKETMKDLNPHYSIYVQYKDTEVDAGFTVQGFDEIKRILTESIS